MKTSSLQSKRRDIHPKWLHRETNDNISLLTSYIHTYTHLHIIWGSSNRWNCKNVHAGADVDMWKWTKLEFTCTCIENEKSLTGYKRTIMCWHQIAYIVLSEMILNKVIYRRKSTDLKRNRSKHEHDGGDWISAYQNIMFSSRNTRKA